MAEVMKTLAAIVSTPLSDDARMDAYYFSFERTGVEIIDRILSAVAIAGKGCHHTEAWNDESIAKYLPDGLTYEESIQKAANDAADALRVAAASPADPDRDGEGES